MKDLHGYKIPQELADDLSEIINLESIMQLPKATEYFISDLHGEFEAFDHIMRNCSGVISIKVAQLFKTELTKKEQQDLCYIIYYPEDFLENVTKPDDEWQILLNQLVRLTRFVSVKYTRSKVRKAMPEEYAYILEELLYQYDQEDNKEDYYEQIFSKIIELNLANSFAITLAKLIQQFVVDHLHVLGDIYDRGPYPDLIVDRLMEVPSIDIQLGNHDLIWIGAYAGSLACLAVALRITLRYGNIGLLEKGYNIDLSRLKKFARKHYKDNPAFRSRGETENLSEDELLDITTMHQAISIIQFKLEGQIIKRRPEFKMENRLLLDKLSKDRNTINIDGNVYNIHDGCFDLVDFDNPYELTLGEELIIMDLFNQFHRSERFEKHMSFLADKGELYTIYNGNLLFHGCVPLTDEGDFLGVEKDGDYYAGQSLYKLYEEAIEDAIDNPLNHDDFSHDLIWYLWCGEASSLFGKKAMKTFERYFTKEEKLHDEGKNKYYILRDDEEFCTRLLNEFGLPDTGYIINGHTPVKAGESPIRANGKMLIIDGGLNRAYQDVTGVAGYTLVDNSHETYLVAHYPFTSKKEAIITKHDILPKQIIVRERDERMKISQTDIGKELRKQADELREKWNID